METIIYDKGNVQIQDYFFNDIDFDNLFKKLNKTYTKFGEHTLKHYLKNPINDKNELIRRQNLIKKLKKYKFDEKFEEIKKIEDDILWFFKEKDEEIEKLYELVYFKFDFLNENEMILNLSNLYIIIFSPFITILLPILTFIIPYILLKFFNWKLNMGLNIFNILYLIFHIWNNLKISAKISAIILIILYFGMYLNSCYSVAKLAYETNNIINLIHQKLIYVKKFLNYLENISVEINRSRNEKDPDSCVYKKCLFEFKYLEYFNNLFKNLDDNIHLINNKGKILLLFREFKENIEFFKELLRDIGEIDFYYSLHKLKFKFTKYYEDIGIETKELYHPIIENSVKNDINIDKNILITGSNKSGKSTFIKTLAINILLGQTIGLTSSNYFKMPIFDIIDSHLIVNDKIGNESLFQVEINKMKNYLELLKEGKKIFMIIDEIFTSTNHLEGFIISYLIIKEICKYRNGLTIITTHFGDLHKLEDIKNYCFLMKDKYKIKEGYTYEHNAIDLLKKYKFDKNIINEAKKMSLNQNF